MTIRFLPESVVCRIRAGEVVERPASVVKELLENSIDAGALSISLTVDRSGLGSISVSDDGCGMEPVDLTCSTARHATSKMPGDDLEAVTTHGFRGEALAALAAVSTLHIATRVAGADCGWEMTSEESRKTDLRPCAFTGHGTRVTASDLFARHPARLKSLASTRQEMAQIRAAFLDAALAWPEISFTMNSAANGAHNFRASDWNTRAREVTGRKFADNSVPFGLERDGYSVHGLVGVPSWSGHRPGEQHIVINRRPVRDKVVSSALRAVFADLSQIDSPSAAVRLAVPPGAIDINAHPSKSEIRLADPAAVFALVRDAVAGSLGGAGPVSASALARAAAAAARPLDTGPEANLRTLPLGVPLGIINGLYIISSSSEGLRILDAHAAHERIVHEAVKSQFLAGGVKSTPLAQPVSIHLGARGTADIEDRAEDLAAFGLDVHAMDSETVIVSGVPSVLPGVDAVTLVTGIARDLAANPYDDPLRDRIERFSALMSCHAAFRAGDGMTLERMASLLRQVEATPNGSVCLHGRPTTVALDNNELAKLFDR